MSVIHLIPGEMLSFRIAITRPKKGGKKGERNILANKNERVAVVSVHANVIIVERSNGDRLSSHYLNFNELNDGTTYNEERQYDGSVD